jgi:hypothetical protein
MTIVAAIYTAALRQLAEDIAFICYRARRISGETCLTLTVDFGYQAVRFEVRYQQEQAAHIGERDQSSSVQSHACGGE